MLHCVELMGIRGVTAIMLLARILQAGSGRRVPHLRDDRGRDAVPGAAAIGPERRANNNHEMESVS